MRTLAFAHLKAMLAAFRRAEHRQTAYPRSARRLAQYVAARDALNTASKAYILTVRAEARA